MSTEPPPAGEPATTEDRLRAYLKRATSALMETRE